MEFEALPDIERVKSRLYEQMTREREEYFANKKPSEE